MESIEDQSITGTPNLREHKEDEIDISSQKFITTIKVLSENGQILARKRSSEGTKASPNRLEENAATKKVVDLLHAPHTENTNLRASKAMSLEVRPSSNLVVQE